MPYEERSYRHWVQSDLHSFRVQVKDSDLFISAESELENIAARALRDVRAVVESYIRRDPTFAETLDPHDVPADAPPIIKAMSYAARLCEVGPMAAVAGAVAEHVGREILKESTQVIVENGGDIFLNTTTHRIAAIFAGDSPLSEKIGIAIDRLNQPLGLCTSSGTVGPSLSFGQADAAIVLSPSPILADAAATALANRIKESSDIEPSLEHFLQIEGILGAVVILGEHLGAAGEIELVAVDT